MIMNANVTLDGKDQIVNKVKKWLVFQGCIRPYAQPSLAKMAEIAWTKLMITPAVVNLAG